MKLTLHNYPVTSIDHRTLLLSLIVIPGIVSGCSSGGSADVDYVVQNNLFAIDSDGTKELIHLYPDSDSSTDENVIRVSQNQKHVAYTKWEEAHFVIYVADLPEVSNIHIAAEQTIAEGSGGLDIASLGWVDDDTLEYREEEIACGETGSAALQNPTTDCDGAIIKVYRVDIDTGERELSDQWFEKRLPL